MSHEGKLNRGQKWFSLMSKGGEGENDIKNDPNKITDVEYYIKHTTPTAKVEVKKETKSKEKV